MGRGPRIQKQYSAPVGGRRLFLVCAWAVLSSCNSGTQDAAANESNGPEQRAENEVFDIAKVDPEFDQNLDAYGRPKVDLEIYFGKDVPDGDFLETVKIEPPTYGALPSGEMEPVCTGVLIAPTVVATAGHCFPDVANVDSRITFGAFIVEEDGDSDSTFETVAVDISAAPRAISETLTISMPGGETNAHGVPDIVLLKIERAPPQVSPVQLASVDDFSAAKFGRIVGFGYTEKDTFGDKVLSDVNIVTPTCTGSGVYKDTPIDRSDLYSCVRNRELVAGLVSDVPTICSMQKKVEECRQASASLTEAQKQARCAPDKIIEREFRTEGDRRPAIQKCADTCNGDSGGPLFVPTAASMAAADAPEQLVTAYGDAMDRKNYRLAGITSRAVDNKYISAHNTPVLDRKCGNGGVYTLMSGDTLTWVQKQAACWESGGLLNETGDPSLPIEQRLKCNPA